MPRDRDTSKPAPRGARARPGGKGRDGGERPARSGGKDFGERKSFGEKKPYGAKKTFGDKKAFGDKKPYGDKASGGKRPFAAKGPRSRDDRDRPRPRFDRDDRPDHGSRKPFRPREERSGDDRPRFKPREERGGEERPRFRRDDRGGEDRPRFKPREDRGDRPFKPRDRDDRAPRGEGRPAGRFSEAKFGDKRPFKGKGEGFRKDGDRPRSGGFRRDDGDKPFSRGPRKPREDFAGPDRSGEKPWQRRERPQGERQEGPRDDVRRRDGDERPRFSRPRDDRDGGDRPRFDRSDRPKFDRARSDRPQSERFKSDRPRGERRDWQEHPRSEGRDERPRGEADESRIFVKRPAFGGRGAYRERKPETDRRSKRPAVPEAKKSGERIAKRLARAGLCSRRDAEEWITQGRVTVNGRVLTSPALDVTERDVILVDGKPLPERERTRLFLYHKPRGLMTTHADPEGRPTVFDNLPEHLPRLISIGRLDFNTEGLLLLTNDGGLARALELPETGWLRRYRVRAHGTVTQAQLDELRNGVEVDGVKYGSIDAQLEHDQGANVWIVFAIREGKNREVRNVLAHLGLEVNRLIRVSYGPFQLAELGEGEVDEVKTRVLREQLGDKVIELAGAEFNASSRPSKISEGAERVHEDTPVKRKRSVVADRKGRRVLVERSGEQDEDAEARPYRRPKRTYHGKRELEPKD
ncbi:pseudouridine synthase [Bradyrhizobium sp. U87765 SZCCT0131]|uniref:pseudouridine synthase n=1 Tax=unclassified Bradyrhizobium TaxID=2631580 RepID=UPI001BA60836|nr:MULTISPECIES: pseudouridine synthase [unclassified Bradyrhizobium]MBR1218700.1 pseudouridine synthase [Bradyrhizobium sp. U87765 SZCCT0131]MBR1265541.1 pseudouridine synthase [Bradyrhizobium sp. U87765 SZCCT0134]MBR1304199.1 pseudouridine synthase [Bradyrhizobium sp. U87765 SZCCT0110]MBR1319804.1 pseudouridine synthase [Bradyrhizobium sp. U87765 SZCCT0109]MBR1348130.1 pseudouridine synthase [Bradyrhizobium sp. U87765 SZCCT0048]